MADVINVTNKTLPGKRIDLRFVISHHEFFIFTFLFVVIALFAIICNALVVSAFLKYKSLRMKTVNHMITSLSASDCLVGLTSIPLWVYILHGMVFHKTIIKDLYIIWQILDMFSGIVSILHLVVISCDVYYAVAFPLRRRQNMKSLYYNVVLFFVWFIPAVVASLSMLPNFKGYLYFVTVVFFILPLFIIFIANFRITLLLNHRKRRLREIGSVKREIKDARTLVLVILCFLFTWGPFYIISILIYQGIIPYSLTSILCVKVLHYGNSAINPVIYAIRIPQFKIALRRLIGFRVGPARVHADTLRGIRHSRAPHPLVHSDLFTTSSNSERAGRTSTTGTTSTSIKQYAPTHGKKSFELPMTPAISPEQRFSFFI